MIDSAASIRIAPVGLGIELYASPKSIEVVTKKEKDRKKCQKLDKNPFWCAGYEAEQFRSSFRAVLEFSVQFQSNFRAVLEQFQSSFRAISEQF